MESLEQLYARINAGAFIPPPDPTANAGRRKRATMAKAVKLKKGQTFDFASAAKQSAKYPWDEWLNGDLLMLEQSEGTIDDKGTVAVVTVKKDFEVHRDAMPGKLKWAARKRYKVCNVSKRDADGNKLENALIIQARDMTADERVAEDILRAEEEVERKQKRAEWKAKQAAKNGTTTIDDDGDDGDDDGDDGN